MMKKNDDRLGEDDEQDVYTVDFNKDNDDDDDDDDDDLVPCIRFLLVGLEPSFDLLGDNPNGEESRPGEPSAEPKSPAKRGRDPVRRFSRRWSLPLGLLFLRVNDRGPPQMSRMDSDARSQKSCHRSSAESCAQENNKITENTETAVASSIVQQDVDPTVEYRKHFYIFFQSRKSHEFLTKTQTRSQPFKHYFSRSDLGHDHSQHKGK